MRFLKLSTSTLRKLFVSDRNSFLWRYGVSFLAVLVAFGIRFALEPQLGNRAIFIPFVPAIMIAAWVGGLVPALLASLATFLLANYFFAAPISHWSPLHTTDFIAALVYAFSALAVAGLMNALKRERSEVMRRAELLRQEVEQRKRAEETLRFSEERLRAILENSPTMIFLKDTEGRYLVCNHEFEAITHRPAAEIIGQTDDDLFLPAEARIFRANDLSVLKNGLPMRFEEIALHDDGPHTSIVSKFPLRDSSGKIYAIGGVVTDITERKRMEDALRLSEQKYRSLYTNTPVMLHSIDQDGNLVSVSNFWLNSLGYEEEEVIGHKSLEFLTPASQKFAREVILPAYFKSGICMNVPYQMIKKNREIMDVLLSAIAEKDDNGRVSRSLAVLTDVTAQKRAEQALRASETKLRILAETAVDAIISADRSGNITQFNPAAERIFGYTAAEILGRSITSIMPLKFRVRYQTGFERFMARENNQLIGKTTELVGMRKNGMEFPLEISLSSWEITEGKFLTGILRDITERKQAEDALRRSEELLRMTTEGANIDLWSWDVVNDLLDCPKTAEVLDRPPGAPMGLQVFFAYVHPEDRSRVNEEVKSCLRDGDEFDIEYRVLRPDGTLRWRYSKGTPAFHDQRVVRISGMSMDITRRKQAEEEMRRSEELLRLTTEAAGIGLWNWDMATNKLEWNSIEYQQFALPAGTPLNLHTFLHSVHPDDRQRVSAELENCLRDHREMNLEHRILLPDGTVRWNRCKGRATYDQGRPLRFSGMSLDITGTKEAEEALRRSEELLRITTAGAGVGLWNWDVVNDTLEWNPEEYQQCALHKDTEMHLQTFLDRVHPEDRAWVVAAMQACVREDHELNMEYRVVWPDGSVHWRYCRGRPSYVDRRPVRVSGISLDVTERRHAQEQLKRSEEWLRLATESTDTGLWNWNETTGSVDWTRIVSQHFGRSPDHEINYQTFLDCLHSDDREKVARAMRQSIQTETPFEAEFRVIWPDQSVHWLWAKARPSLNNQGRAVRLIGTTMEITARKQAEEALNRQAQMLNLAQVLAFDLNDKILFWNHGAEKLYGWSEAEAVGKKASDLLRTEYSDPLQLIKEKLFQSGSWEGELSHYRKDGKQICVASHWALFKDAQNKPVAILEANNNITKLKKAETDLQNAQKALAKHAEQLEQAVERRTDDLQRSLRDMESFCYTIAHDLRAPLRAMSGFTYSLAEDYAPQLGPAGRDYCERIHAASGRMSQLISDLLVYGRLTHRELPSEPVDLLAEIEKVLARIAPQIEERHAAVDVDKPLPKVCGDAPVLDQILENLITNAVKFVPPERQPRIHIFAEHRDDNIRLCVEDNGIGILPEHWRKIFRPFERLHTTDYPGTGIGLAIVERGIEKMGGRVGVESTPEHGSRFWVELPEQCKRL